MAQGRDAAALQLVESLQRLPLTSVTAVLPQLQDLLARCHAQATPSLALEDRTAKGCRTEGATCEARALLERLPPWIVAEMWPEDRVVLGGQVSKWLCGILHPRNPLLRKLPSALLEKIWPAERVVMGMRVCKWLRRCLKLHAPRIVLLAGSDSPWCDEGYQIVSSFRQFRRSEIHLQWANVKPLDHQDGEQEERGAKIELYNRYLRENWERLCHGIRFALQDNPKLTKIDVSSNRLLEDIKFVDWLKTLCKCKALTHLDMRDCGLNGSNAHGLSLLPACSQLTHLDISQNHFNAGYFGSEKDLANLLQKCTALQQLNISGCGLEGHDDLHTVLECLTSLTHLDVSENPDNGDTETFWPNVLRGCTSLTHLDLTDNQITICGDLLPVLGTLTNLNTLFLGGNHFFDLAESTDALAHIGCCTALTELALDETRLGSSSLAALGRAVRACTALQRLNLSHAIQYCGGDEEAEAAMSLAASLAVDMLAASCLRLAHLNLCFWRSVDWVQAMPRSLGALQALSALYLCHNDMGAAGARKLAEILPALGQLVVLDLADNLLRDAGAACVAGALSRCGRLQVLGLASNDIGDEGAAQLAHSFPAWGESIECTDAPPLYFVQGTYSACSFVDFRGNSLTDDGGEYRELVANESGVYIRMYDDEEGDDLLDGQ